ncbi:hypothetical protein C8Q79DRAFT_930668 [Trametes meyenii]|nr:hypothetical protein C8Q79DRAFT_930668 [Trametes meyenii]
MDPRYQGLFVYRSKGTTSSNGHAINKVIPKTSTDKAAEDATEGAKREASALTGVHKTLLDKGLSHDPPPLRKRLRGSDSCPEVREETKADQHHTLPLRVVLSNDGRSSRSLTPVSMLSSDASSDAGRENTGPKHARHAVLERESTPVRNQVNMPRTPQRGHPTGDNQNKDVGQRVPATVVVTFHPQNDPTQPSEEVYVQEGAKLAVDRRVVDGSEVCFVQLSQVLPLAIEQASMPMKKKGGRLFRAGFTAGSRVSIGSVEDISEGRRVAKLESSKINAYQLEPAAGHKDMLLCHMFLEPGASDTKMNMAKVRVTGNSDTYPVSKPLESSPAAIRPRNGFEVKGTLKSEAAQKRDENEGAFIEYLRKLVDGPKNQWRKVKASQGCRACNGMLDELEWEKSKGGYQIPDDYDDAGEFAGCHFIKLDILKALHLGPSQANSDANLFRARDLERLPDLQAWYNDPKGTYSKRFEKMTLREFQKYKADSLASLKKDKARKYAGAGMDGESSESRPVKKAKAKHSYPDSDEIDD